MHNWSYLNSALFYTDKKTLINFVVSKYIFVVSQVIFSKNYYFNETHRFVSLIVLFHSKRYAIITICYYIRTVFTLSIRTDKAWTYGLDQDQTPKKVGVWSG